MSSSMLIEFDSISYSRPPILSESSTLKMWNNYSSSDCIELTCTLCRNVMLPLFVSFNVCRLIWDDDTNDALHQPCNQHVHEDEDEATDQEDVPDAVNIRKKGKGRGVSACLHRRLKTMYPGHHPCVGTKN